MVAYNFNAAQHEPKYSGSGSLPPGKYRGVIVDSAQEPTKSGGGMLVLTIQVIEGPLAGQKMIDRLNLHNPSAKAVEIANKQLSAYCHVVNVHVISDTAQLHNIPFCFEVAFDKGEEPTAEKPQGGFTRIVAVADVNGNEPGKAKGPAPVAAAAPPPPPAADVAPAGGGWGGGQPAATPQEQPTQQPAGATGGWGGQPAGQPPAAPPAAQGWAQNGAGAGNGGWGNK